VESPPSPGLRHNIFREAKNGGKGIRTPDIQLAKLALYQLSYAPGGGIPNVEFRNPNARNKMPDSKAVRHFRVSNQTKTELCATVSILSELRFLSIPESSRHLQNPEGFWS
jgi:hypothetical protein